MIRLLAICALPFALLASAATPALAHKPSDSYLKISVQENVAEGQWDIALRDLDHAIGLDGNDDGSITWGELRARQDTIATYASPACGSNEAIARAASFQPLISSMSTVTAATRSCVSWPTARLQRIARSPSAIRCS